MAKKAATKPTSKSAKKPSKVVGKVVAKAATKGAAKPAPKSAPKKAAAKPVAKVSAEKPQIKGKPVDKKPQKVIAKEVVKEVVAKSTPKPVETEQVEGAEIIEVKPKKASKAKSENGAAPAEKISKAEAKRLKKIEVAQGQEEAKWKELHDKYKSVKAVAYRMSETFEERTPLDHKVLGWGFILSVVNDRLEVLFETGIKQLISNYKANN